MPKLSVKHKVGANLFLYCLLVLQHLESESRKLLWSSLLNKIIFSSVFLENNCRRLHPPTSVASAISRQNEFKNYIIVKENQKPSFYHEKLKTSIARPRYTIIFLTFEALSTIFFTKFNRLTINFCAQRPCVANVASSIETFFFVFIIHISRYFLFHSLFFVFIYHLFICNFLVAIVIYFIILYRIHRRRIVIMN
jgi:hypothetical protein